MIKMTKIMIAFVLLTLCYTTGTAKPHSLPISEALSDTLSSTLSTHRFQSRDHFVKALLPHAVKAGKQLGVDPKVILAQAALESNWGKSILKHENKRTSYNLFGIKYTPGRGEQSLTVRTKEFKNGKSLYKRAKFKSYNNFSEAFEDYTRIIQKPHYKKHMKDVRTPLDYATSLQKAGYATDPKYAKKIMQKYKDSVLQNIEY